MDVVRGPSFTPPSGHVFRVERQRGPAWYAKYRLPDGRQVQKKIGPAWQGRGRPFPGYVTKRLAEAWLDDVLAQARFASRQPALLDLMFTSLHRPGADASLREANDRAFAAPIALIANAQANGDIIADDPDRVAIAVLATL